MSPTYKQLKFVQFCILFPLLLVGVFCMLFWTAWGRGSKTFDHGPAESMLHMATMQLMLPAVLSVITFLLAVWTLRQIIAGTFDPETIRRWVPAYAGVLISATAMTCICGTYLGFAYAFYCERSFPIAPYEMTGRMAVVLYEISLVLIQAMVGLAARIAKDHEQRLKEVDMEL